jgi:hypothetical protein
VIAKGPIGGLYRGELPLYMSIAREERHLGAVLFHVLSLPYANNVEKLLKRIACDWQIDPDQFGIYFEFSYLRDDLVNSNSMRLSYCIRR